MTTDRKAAIGREIDFTQAEQAAKDKWNKYCQNCGKALDEKSKWVRKVATGPEDELEWTEESCYCDECIRVDGTRLTKGRPPPAMESESGD
jgi:hypothetical protein